MVRQILDGLCIRLDGKPAAASTVYRKRAVFYNALDYAVEAGHLDANPIDRLSVESTRSRPSRRPARGR